MNEPQIILEKIGVEFLAPFGSIGALKDVNLRVEKGTYISVVGHSGSGKSTLLSVVGGLLTPTSGTVSVDGERIYQSTEKQRSLYRAIKIGFVFQSASLLPSLTVMENLLFPVMFSGVNNKAAEEEASRHLEAVGLADKAEAHPYQLSGGESRRVSLARALMNRPDIFLADEPTGDLDEVAEQQVMDLLEAVHKTTGATLILVTHNIELSQSATKRFRMTCGSLAEI